jgi:hypothetical protein
LFPDYPEPKILSPGTWNRAATNLKVRGDCDDFTPMAHCALDTLTTARISRAARQYPEPPNKSG